MLLEANMLHELNVFVPHKQIVEIDNSGKAWLSYPYEPTRKRFYKIFEHIINIFSMLCRIDCSREKFIPMPFTFRPSTRIYQLYRS
jgi:hypothetical protein